MSDKNKQLTIVPPHVKVSRPATDKDAGLIMDLAAPMQLLCVELVKKKVFADAFALHHSQITKKPINFFVLNSANPRISEMARNSIFVNCRIINHTNHPVEKMEGCLSFPGRLSVRVERFHKIVCEYQYPVRQDNGSYILSEVHTENMSGLLAQIVQHENQHAQGKFIYPLK
jgi:peptide deformylase